MSAKRTSSHGGTGHVRPWSITTTVRNPARIPPFLRALSEFAGRTWDARAQVEYQAALIQHRLYGAGNPQFLNRLADQDRALVEDEKRPITREEAQRIFDSRRYRDPPMRGRQSFNILRKFGLAAIADDRTLRITDSGRELLQEPDNFGDIMLRCLLKWQLPEPNDRFHKNADIIPFVGILKLIRQVNNSEKERGRRPKGISLSEFQTFGPTLLKNANISRRAEIISRIRGHQQGKNRVQQDDLWATERRKFLRRFLGSACTGSDIAKLESDLRDYGDNAIRYFRVTGLVWLRGDGRYVDLSPDRTTELNRILSGLPSKSKSFNNAEEYFHYMADSQKPHLPWESVAGYRALIKEYADITKQPGIEVPATANLAEWRSAAREMRQAAVEVKALHAAKYARSVEGISSCIKRLRNIRDEPSPPVALEQLCAMALHALNDANEIKPNYPKGEDNQPTGTAPGGKPDIECLYSSFSAICEVTMQTGARQHDAEGQSVVRHAREFNAKHNDPNGYCLFVAPAIHRDTLNLFVGAIKKVYEGIPHRIVPLTINQLVQILEGLKEHRRQEKLLSHKDIERLFRRISEAGSKSSTTEEWRKCNREIINAWIEEVFS